MAGDPERMRQLNGQMEATSADMSSKPKVVQPVVRVVTENSFVHFYLACGHLITIEKGELKGPLPAQIRCWACVQENEKS